MTKRFASVLFLAALLSAGAAASAANVCEDAILARLSELQVKAESTQNRVLFSALQTGIRRAKQAGIDVRRLDPSSLKAEAKKAAVEQERSEQEATSAATDLNPWSIVSWSKANSYSTYSPDGKLVAIVQRSAGLRINVVRAKDGVSVSTIPLTEFDPSRHDFQFIGDDIIAFTNFDMGRSLLYDIAQPLTPRAFDADSKPQTIILSGDKKRLIAAHSLKFGDQQIEVFDFQTGRPIAKTDLPGSSRIVSDKAGNRIARQDGKWIHVYDVALDRIFSFETPSSGSRVALSPDGKDVLVSGTVLSLWSVDRGQMKRSYETTKGNLEDIRFVDGGREIVAFDMTESDGGYTALIFKVDRKSPIETIPLNVKPLEVGVADDGNSIAYHAFDDNYYFMDRLGNQP
jgi:hypothetical protein